MPLVELLPQTARSFHNPLLGKHEMAFDVLMWRDPAKETVFHWLKEEGHKGPDGQGNLPEMVSTVVVLLVTITVHLLSDLSKKDIEVLPMEKVRLAWHGRTPLQTENFMLQDEWTANTHLPNVRTFYFMCKYVSYILSYYNLMQ